MGNFFSRHATYCTKEEVLNETPEPEYEGTVHRILNLDPRSPSAEIVRTPIQVICSERDDFRTPETTPCKQTTNLDTPVSTFSTKAMRSSDVDLPSLDDLTSVEASGIEEFDNMLESIEAELLEIEKSLNPTVTSENIICNEKPKEVKKIPSQKLNFSPDKENSSKSLPKKTRTPLGTRSSNAPSDVMSPATYLRMKQQRSVYDNAFQKYPLSQKNGLNCENTPPHAMIKAATLPRKRASVEWDRDATMII
ncbi:cell division cycle-associated protein 3-like [Ischnura elegans]|uniref:cell division cycle-associated protein 3-like n=1 Tax=Ischnura elegans TaxID=197161 RepID=UPI001ED866A4|nr:cell division cycle-associated protein 3-like [Ischnura elegans]